MSKRSPKKATSKQTISTAEEPNWAESDGRQRWEPSYLVGANPFSLQSHCRKELIRLAHCPQNMEDNFINDLQNAAGWYIAVKNNIKKEMPKLARRNLRNLEKKVFSALKTARQLPLTVELLFNFRGRDPFVSRKPKITLSGLLIDIQHVSAIAKRWPAARLVDYPKRRLMIDLAHALRVNARVQLTAARNGTFHSCAQVLLRGIDKQERHLDDLTRTLRTALRFLK